MMKSENKISKKKKGCRPALTFQIHDPGHKTESIHGKILKLNPHQIKC
jgi:hypothetical protein